MPSNKKPTSRTRREEHQFLRDFLDHAKKLAGELEYEEKGKAPTRQIGLRTHRGMYDLFQEAAYRNGTNVSSLLQTFMELYVVSPPHLQELFTRYSYARYREIGALPRSPRKQNQYGTHVPLKKK